MQIEPTKLEAICTLHIEDDDTFISGPHTALVHLWLTEGPLNTYWYGVAEIAASDGELDAWVFGEKPNYMNVQFSDGKSGLATQIVCRREHDIFRVSFFGQTSLE